MKVIRIMVYGFLGFCVPAAIATGLIIGAVRAAERGNMWPWYIIFGVIILACSAMIGYMIENS